MGPFVAIAASVLPQILRHLSGAEGQDRNDTVEQAVAEVVQSVTRVDDPETARKKIASDPNVEAELRVRLSELSASLDDASRAVSSGPGNQAVRDLEQRIVQRLDGLTAQVNAASDAQVQAAHQTAQQAEDAASARSTLARIASPGSPTVIAPPLLSIIVVLGFFGALGFIVSGRFDPSSDTAKLQIVNIVIGALTAGFATVLNFWLGSSQGSKNKDLANFSLQHIQALQAGRLSLSSQDNAPSAAPTTPVFHATRQPAEAASPSGSSVLAAAVQSSPRAAPTAGQAPAATARQLPTYAAGLPEVSGSTSPLAVQTDKDAAFRACVAFVLKNEGGFVDDPEDPGGATNMGITIGALRAWRGQPVTVEDVRNLSYDEAVKIYRANYWKPLECDQLPLGVDMVVFDFGVNAGIRRSAMTLQKVLGVAEDGLIGPETLAALAKEVPAQVVNRFGAARLEYYKQLKEWPKFGKGWTDREAESQSEARSLMSGSVAVA